MSSEDAKRYVFIEHRMLLSDMKIYYFKDQASIDKNKTLCVRADTLAEARQKLMTGRYYTRYGGL